MKKIKAIIACIIAFSILFAFSTTAFASAATTTGQTGKKYIYFEDYDGKKAQKKAEKTVDKLIKKPNTKAWAEQVQQGTKGSRSVNFGSGTPDHSGSGSNNSSIQNPNSGSGGNPSGSGSGKNNKSSGNLTHV